MKRVLVSGETCDQFRCTSNDVRLHSSRRESGSIGRPRELHSHNFRGSRCCDSSGPKIGGKKQHFTSLLGNGLLLVAHREGLQCFYWDKIMGFPFHQFEASRKKVLFYTPESLESILHSGKLSSFAAKRKVNARGTVRTDRAPDKCRVGNTLDARVLRLHMQHLSGALTKTNIVTPR